VLDEVVTDLNKVRFLVSAEDRRLIEEHTAFVREVEQKLHEESGESTSGSGSSSSAKSDDAPDVSAIGHAVPELESGVEEANDNIPKLSKMQIDLMVNAFSADFARIATLQYTKSVGGARHHWLNVTEGHHELSHEPDKNEVAQEKLTRINKWYAEQMAYLARRLAETPEPGGNGSLLDNTLIIWTNELGKGNSHTLDNIPFVLVGNGLDFKMGRSLKYGRVQHNRLLMALSHGFGHHIEQFGNPDFCRDGVLTGLT
jgi:hypothetical protein